MSRKPNRFYMTKVSSSGFSLLEVLLAVSVMTIGVLAVLGVFPAIVSLNYNAWGTTFLRKV